MRIKYDRTGEETWNAILTLRDGDRFRVGRIERSTWAMPSSVVRYGVFLSITEITAKAAGNFPHADFYEDTLHEAKCNVEWAVLSTHLKQLTDKYYGENA